MKKHLVFVGGGHAHLTAMVRMKDYTDHDHRVTVISPDAYHCYSGMGPGMLSGIYRPQDIRFNIRKMTEDRDGIFVEDRVVRIDPLQKMLVLASGSRLAYDVVSFNIGSEVSHGSLDNCAENVYTVKPIANLLRARKDVEERIRCAALRIVVVGGGPAGVEIAGNVWRLVHDSHGKAEINLVAGRRLLRGLPDRVCSLTTQSFRERGITVVEGRHVSAIGKDNVVFDDSTSLSFDVAFVSTGVKPATIFRESGLPVGNDGGLLVNHCLQSVQYPDIFGGGDCISLDGYQLAKVGVFAVRENMILYKNLMASLDGGDMMTFTPQSHYMLIFNLGNNKGILWKKKLVWHGRIAFLLKDYIDRKFMRTFQVSGEQGSVDI
jgi:NADH dehydrogenase FAD-containing subunit